jgi:hypothetical protein
MTALVAAGTGAAGAGGVFQVDQRHRLAALRQLPGIGIELDRDSFALVVHQLEVGDVEAQVIDVRGNAGAAHAGQPRTAGRRRGAVEGGKGDGHGFVRGWRDHRVVTAATGTQQSCADEAGCGQEEFEWFFHGSFSG